MRIIKISKLTALAGLALLGTIGTAHASYTTQGVTFTQTFINANSYSLQIDGLLDATGNWANVTQVRSIAIKEFGNFTTASVTPGGATFSGNELNANFCSGGNSGGACFTWIPELTATNSMLFTFTFTGAAITSSMTPHVKVGFLCPAEPSQNTRNRNVNNPPRVDACGSLLSESFGFEIPGDDDDDDDDDDDTDLPEPGSLALLGLGLLGLGVSRRRKL